MSPGDDQYEGGDSGTFNMQPNFSSPRISVSLNQTLQEGGDGQDGPDFNQNEEVELEENPTQKELVQDIDCT